MQSDLYALGLVLYELFTGKRAFEASTPQQLAEQQESTTPKPPSSLTDGLEATVSPSAPRVTTSSGPIV
jgi:serine/threonine-protein kinase